MDSIWVGPGGARKEEAVRRDWDREFPGGERAEALSGVYARFVPGTSLLRVPEPKEAGRMNVIGL